MLIYQRVSPFIVDLPIEYGDFPSFLVCWPECDEMVSRPSRLEFPEYREGDYPAW